ncbi:MAG: (d)CMP kinase [Desulfuromonadales bacterium]|nr:(d)CMP kinase [Desulfuromonadales bacterium]
MSQKKRGLVIAIDGPSGAGKSTIAHLLAKRLGYLQIDTGAMYRAVAVLISRTALDLADLDAVQRFCADLNVRLETVAGCQKVFANGQEVTSQIRTAEVSVMTSRISALKPVRDALLLAQREMGRDGGVVLEGRDIGTVVFPDADLKFFLTASPEVRGKRRYDEMIARGEQVTLRETIEAAVQRDAQDTQRDIAPLKQADDAIAIDSSDIGIEDVVDRMEAFVREKTAQRESYS